MILIKPSAGLRLDKISSPSTDLQKNKQKKTPNHRNINVQTESCVQGWLWHTTPPCCSSVNACRVFNKMFLRLCFFLRGTKQDQNNNSSPYTGHRLDDHHQHANAQVTFICIYERLSAVCAVSKCTHRCIIALYLSGASLIKLTVQEKLTVFARGPLLQK